MIISNCVEALSTDHGYFVDIGGQLTANFAAYYPHTNKTAKHNLFPTNPDFQSDIMQRRWPAETPCFSN